MIVEERLREILGPSTPDDSVEPVEFEKLGVGLTHQIVRKPFLNAVLTVGCLFLPEENRVHLTGVHFGEASAEDYISRYGYVRRNAPTRNPFLSPEGARYLDEYIEPGLEVVLPRNIELERPIELDDASSGDLLERVSVLPSAARLPEWEIREEGIPVICFRGLKLASREYCVVIKNSLENESLYSHVKGCGLEDDYGWVIVPRFAMQSVDPSVKNDADDLWTGIRRGLLWPPNFRKFDWISEKEFKLAQEMTLGEPDDGFESMVEGVFGRGEGVIKDVQTTDHGTHSRALIVDVEYQDQEHRVVLRLGSDFDDKPERNFEEIAYWFDRDVFSLGVTPTAVFRSDWVSEHFKRHPVLEAAIDNIPPEWIEVEGEIAASIVQLVSGAEYSSFESDQEQLSVLAHAHGWGLALFKYLGWGELNHSALQNSIVMADGRIATIDQDFLNVGGGAPRLR